MTAPAHCPFYCEENVWHLCEHASIAGADRRVLWISNPARQVAMWGQRAAAAPELPIAWDYHVVLLLRPKPHPGRGGWQVWDLDARTPEPRPADEWLRVSFGAIGLFPRHYTPRFRMVTSADYRRHFRSDRSHMRDANGQVRQAPPPWPLILGERPACAPHDEGSNLERFIDTHDPTFLGELFDLAGLREWFAQ